MRSALATMIAVLLLLGPTGPVLAANLADDGTRRQVPNVRPFDSAHFGMAGTVKLDGVTVEVLGEGDLALPDRQRASFKFGPFTAEVIMLGDAVYTRTRFERVWSRQFVPEPVTVGPFSSAEITRLQEDVRLVGRELVGDVMTEHYTSSLDFQAVAGPLAEVVPDPDVRRALETLEGSVDVWVSVGDRMIRQERLLMTLILPSIEPDGDEAPATVDLTIAYSQLNEPASIEQPIRNDPSPLRTPRPSVIPVIGPAGSPAAPGGRPAPPPVRAPAQIPVQTPRR
jgi:hypothetical protein